MGGAAGNGCDGCSARFPMVVGRVSILAYRCRKTRPIRHNTVCPRHGDDWTARKHGQKWGQLLTEVV